LAGFKTVVPAPVRGAGNGDAGRYGFLAGGDAVRFTATEGQQVTATAAAEILVWEMHATIAD